MSAAAMHTAVARKLPRHSSSPTPVPGLFRVLLAVTVATDLSILAVGSFLSRPVPSRVGWELLAWVLVVALVDLAPVSMGTGPQLGMDLPLLLAAGFLYGPIVGGSIAFVGYADMRELRGRIPVMRALFNRAQTSLSTMAAAATFQLLGGQVGHWPHAAGVTLLALAADCIVNYSMVLVAVLVHERMSLHETLGAMKFGSRSAFAGAYACFGFLGLLLAEIHLKLGIWGLASFVMPVLLARQAFSHSQRLEVADRQLRDRGQAIRELSGQIANERRDERLSVAAGLHDEVLPPLYRVHLMGQVLRQDLASGRLLALEEDLPQLLSATELAGDAMRVLIRDLRQSSVGPGGLVATLRLLTRELESASPSTRIRVECEEVGGSPLIQLLAYQVAREALRNAVRHADASEIRLTLKRDGSDMRLVVEDNGCGFKPPEVDRNAHFGLQLMKERVELAGGVLQVDSVIGDGTCVVVRLPAEASSYKS